MSKLTPLSPFPKELKQSLKCKLLHKKTPMWDGETEEINGKKHMKIYWICHQCKADLHSHIDT